MKKYCEEIATKVWSDLSRSNLVTGEKLGSTPEIRFTALGDKFLGMAYGDHIELNEKYLHTDEPERLKLVLFHELAHVAEFRSTGIMGHGPLWHAISLFIGGNGDSRGDLPGTENEDVNDICFGFAAIVALGGALFFAMYCAFNYLGITNRILCGSIGIGGIVLSLVLWAGCCKTFGQVKAAVIIQAVLSLIFTLGVVS